LNGQMLRGFLLVSFAERDSPQPSLVQGTAESFRFAGGKITTVNAITKAALVLLAERYPSGVPFDELVTDSRAKLVENGGGQSDAATLEHDAQVLGNDLLQAYAVGVVELHLRMPHMSRTPSARPVASPLARLQAERGDKVTNLRHEPVAMDEIGRRILPLLDGSRDWEGLAATLAQLAKDGVLLVRDRKSGALLTSGPILDDILRRALETGLPRLARGALLLD